MNTLADILLFISLAGLVAGLIKSKHQKKKVGIIFGAGILIALIMLALGGSKTTSNTRIASTKTSSIQKQAKPTPSTITGYGALLNDWNIHHIQDKRFSGMVYDATPGLGLDGQHNDKYYDVSTMSGRILTYTMRLPNESNLSAAKAGVMKEFPGDIIVIWQKDAGQCSQMEVASKTLGSALGGKNIGDSDGQVLVEFQTDSASTENLNSYYNASNVNLATFSLGSYNTAASAPDC